jgi:phosphoribosylaminoimidazole-succinocarboxamide synthase
VIEADLLAQALACPLQATHFETLGARYQGKVRDCYSPGDGTRIMITTDRISAFDRVLGTLPLKGQVLNHCSAFWFDQTRDVCPNHLLGVPDPNVQVVKECQALPVEMVVRAYLTGTTSTSIWVHYQKGVREFCGHRLPEGLRQHERLPEPLLTPSTKAMEGGHDASVSRAQLLAQTKLEPEIFDQAASYALALFRRGQELCQKQGLILVDTKYEFGRLPNGEVVVIDEIHTPDSSRYWYVESYAERFAKGEHPESFDKEYVRRFLAEQGFLGEGPVPLLPDAVRIEASRRYIQAVERITGGPFEPNLEEPLSRIRRNLSLPLS